MAAREHKQTDDNEEMTFFYTLKRELFATGNEAKRFPVGDAMWRNILPRLVAFLRLNARHGGDKRPDTLIAFQAEDVEKWKAAHGSLAQLPLELRLPPSFVVKRNTHIVICKVPQRCRFVSLFGFFFGLMLCDSIFSGGSSSVSWANVCCVLHRWLDFQLSSAPALVGEQKQQQSAAKFIFFPSFPSW